MVCIRKKYEYDQHHHPTPMTSEPAAAVRKRKRSITQEQKEAITTNLSSLGVSNSSRVTRSKAKVQNLMVGAEATTSSDFAVLEREVLVEALRSHATRVAAGLEPIWLSP